VPYAWHLVGDLAEQLHGSGADLADNRVPPPDEAARGQLLRMMASDAMRGAVERHFGVRLAFQSPELTNCGPGDGRGGCRGGHPARSAHDLVSSGRRLAGTPGR
jgi:hypothetical protein